MGRVGGDDVMRSGFATARALRVHVAFGIVWAVPFAPPAHRAPPIAISSVFGPAVEPFEDGPAPSA